MRLTSLYLSKLWFLGAFGLYALIFFIPLPPQIIFKGVQVVDEIIIVVACLVIYYGLGKNHPAWKALILTLVLFLFTLPLLRIWETAESNYNLILGLLPWSDASGYYSDAISLLQGGLLNTFSGHRPLFASLLAVLLKLSSNNLQLTIVIITIINGMAVFLFANEIQESFGPIVSIGTILLSQLFYRHFTGALMTEQIGFPLGLIGISSLFYATRSKTKWLYATGLFFLAIGLFARAGAFFILPALLIVGIIIFKENDKFSGKNIILFIFPLLFAWSCNFALGQIVSSPGIVAMGNFSYTLYGQAVGGKGWTQVFSDHPEIAALADKERTQTVYRLAINEISRNPSGIATGVFKAWKDFFKPSMFAGFGYVQPGDKFSSLFIQPILTVLMLIGIFQCWKHRAQGIYLILIGSTCGILVSVPFIPPSESAFMRVYAATIMVPALIACIGILAILPAKTATHQPPSARPNNRILVQTIFGITLVLISTAGACILTIIPKDISYTPFNCPAGEIPVQIRLSRTSLIQINTNETWQPTYVPSVSARDFRQSMRRFPGIYHTFSDTLIKTITPPVILSFSRNMLTGEFYWVIANTELVSMNTKILRACGQTSEDNSSVLVIISTQ